VDKSELKAEHPKNPRRQETIGFTVPKIEKGKKYFSNKVRKAIENIDNPNAGEEDFYLTTPLVFREEEAKFMDEHVQKAMTIIALSSSMVYIAPNHCERFNVISATGQPLYGSGMVTKRPKRILPDAHSLPVAKWQVEFNKDPFRQKIENELLLLGMSSTNPAAAVASITATNPATGCDGNNNAWSELSIRLIKGGMIENSSAIKSMFDHLPNDPQLRSFISKVKNMPYVLQIQMDSEKNDSGHMCPFVAGRHEQNNIYFHLYLPITTQTSVNGKSMEAYIEPTINFINAIITKTISRATGFSGWFMVVRCWCQRCAKKTAFYKISWEAILLLVQPMVSHMLANCKCTKNGKQGVYSLPRSQ
jgi:hypothetical protein